MDDPTVLDDRTSEACTLAMHPGVDGPDLGELLSPSSPSSTLKGLALLDLRGKGRVVRQHVSLANKNSIISMKQFREALLRKVKEDDKGNNSRKEDGISVLLINQKEYRIVEDTECGGNSKKEGAENVVLAVRNGNSEGVGCWELPMGFALLVHWEDPATADGVLTRVSKHLRKLGLN